MNEGAAATLLLFGYVALAFLFYIGLESILNEAPQKRRKQPPGPDGSGNNTTPKA